MKILITGASGYVGSALVDDLRKTHEVIATARNVSRIEQKGIKKLELDILNPEQITSVIVAEQPDLVIHAAALPKRSSASEQVFIDTNVAGASNVASAVANHSSAKMIMISSGCAFKQFPERLILDGSEREMGSSFSKSKNLAEQAVVAEFANSPERLNIIYPPVILHPSQQQGIIIYALQDACATGVITNKVPKGHLNFVTTPKLAELIEAIATDRNANGTQRYMITGQRLSTAAFFDKLQAILRDKFNIPSEIREEADPSIETMCAMDESAIQTLRPNFEWQEIDDVITAIIAQNLVTRTDFKKPHGLIIPASKDQIRA